MRSMYRKVVAWLTREPYRLDTAQALCDGTVDPWTVRPSVDTLHALASL